MYSRKKRKKSDSKDCKTNLECRKVKCGANHSRNYAKLTKCVLMNVYSSKKIDSKRCNTTIWEAEK